MRKDKARWMQRYAAHVGAVLIVGLVLGLVGYSLWLLGPLLDQTS